MDIDLLEKYIGLSIKFSAAIGIIVLWFRVIYEIAFTKWWNPF